LNHDFSGLAHPNSGCGEHSSVQQSPGHRLFNGEIMDIQDFVRAIRVFRGFEHAHIALEPFQGGTLKAIRVTGTPKEFPLITVSPGARWDMPDIKTFPENGTLTAFDAVVHGDLLLDYVRRGMRGGRDKLYPHVVLSGQANITSTNSRHGIAAGTAQGRTSESGEMVPRRDLRRTSWKTVTLETAKQGLRAYNEGVDGCIKGADLDDRAAVLFARGLGTTREEILNQVQFIGRDYGGVAGFPSALSLAEQISLDIFAIREQYDQTVRSAAPLLERLPSGAIVELLYAPFIKPLHGKRNWLVWASKFWHFLNPSAFPIIDSRVESFFGVNMSASAQKYHFFADRLRSFIHAHQSWLPELRAVDGGDAQSELKLWDKIFYGLEDLYKAKERRAASGRV
jgi:hypothetical protein